MYGGQGLLGFVHDDNLEFVRGDVRSVGAVTSALVGAEAIVHLAAIVGDPACARQPVLAREVNLDASVQLLDLGRSEGVSRFIFASTCSNYGKMADPSHYVTEESCLRTLSVYAETKVAVERTLLGAREDDQPAVTVLRFATLFGLSPRMRFDLTVNEFTVELLTKRKLVVFGEQFWRPYIHVWDAARAISRVLTASTDVTRGQVFNVGDTSQNYQKGEVVSLINAEIDDEVEIDYVHKDEDPRDYRVSFEKIERILGFHITRTMEDGIREVIGAVRDGIFIDFTSPSYRN
jgi:nucleoside-diphosphate-sugar epimerase